MAISGDQVAHLRWRKASKSQGASNCIELTRNEQGEILVRNSRDPHGAVLAFTKSELDAFLDGARRREFDDLAA